MEDISNGFIKGLQAKANALTKLLAVKGRAIKGIQQLPPVLETGIVSGIERKADTLTKMLKDKAESLDKLKESLPSIKAEIKAQVTPVALSINELIEKKNKALATLKSVAPEYYQLVVEGSYQKLINILNFKPLNFFLFLGLYF